MLIHKSRSPLAKQDSVVRRLEAWLAALPADAEPVETKYLFKTFGTNGNTLNKALKRLKSEGHPLICERIRTHILKCDAKSIWKRSQGITEDAALVEETPMMQEEDANTIIKDLRGWLIESRKPIDPREAQWAKTLHSIDTVFHEIGVPATHQSRTDLQELYAWLMTKSS
jgi:hypothetical protein